MLALSLAAAAFTGLSVAWLKRTMRQQLPALDGERRLPGLSAPAIVRRDRYGVPHIQAANLDDLAEAQGYVVAQDRLWQMDMARRFAAGDLAEVLGPSAVAHDRVQRVLEIRAAAERLTADMDADQKRIFEDYSRGVNAYIAGHQARLPAEFRLLRYKPKPWTPEDCWLISLNMVELLDSSVSTKLEREKVQALLPPTLAMELYPTTTWRDRPPTQSIPPLTDPPTDPPLNVPPEPPEDSQSLAPRSVDGLLALRRAQAFGGHPGAEHRPGSNEWAVSGAHTASGRALLSNDMHLRHSIPDVWHEEDLAAGAFHAAGVALPGMPLIVAGHNAHIAWGFTTLNGDVQDVYVEKTNSAGEYWSGGRWRRPEHDRERIRVRGGRDVLLDLERTDHGPVLTPLLPKERRMLALRWTLYEPKNTGWPILALDEAQDWPTFRAAMSRWWAPTQNVVYADDQGHIGYQAVGDFPLRPAGASPVPMVETGTAEDSRLEWQGSVPFAELPSVFDPASGIVATANSRITPDDYPYPLALNWAEPYRNERIWKWLAGKQRLTAAQMLILQTDTYSEVDRELAQRFAYAIDHASRASARLRQAADILRVWNGIVTLDSVAAQIVDSAKDAFWPLLLQPRLGEAWRLYSWQDKDYVEEEMVESLPAEWLPNRYSNWSDFLAACVERGMRDGGAPRSLGGWTFGSRHHLEIQHPLYGRLPFFRGWTGSGTYPIAGDETTVDQARGLVGPSQRFTMDWSDVDASTENIVMGESGDPLSPYYRDQWPDWYGGRTFPLAFTDGAVLASTRHTLRLLP